MLELRKKVGFWLDQFLFRNISSSNLALFRILFGLLMVVEAARYFVGFIDDYYVKPTFHFHYCGFEFVQVLPPQGMYAVFCILTASALFIATGLFFRASCWVFFALYTYVFLAEKACYNNHYYLICLLSFLLANSDAHKVASIDALRARPVDTTVGAWQLWMLKLQMVVVYFFAGVAKLNADWLKGEPMRMWLAERALRFPAVAPFFTAPWAPYLFSYGGLWLDLSAGFLLLWKRTRVFAILMLGFFHISNHFLFGIGIFPFLALASTVLFIEPESAQRFLNAFRWNKAKIEVLQEVPVPSSQPPETSKHADSRKRRIFACLAVYFALQVFLPLRHWIYGGNVSWTEEGHNFSWHMKLRDKKGVRPRFTVIENGIMRDVDPRTILSRRQLGEMNGDPDLILEFAHFLRDESIRKGVKQPVVIASVYASMNGRPFQRLVHESMDLSRAHKNWFGHAPYIVPLAFSVRDPFPWIANILLGLAIVFMLAAMLFFKVLRHKPLTWLSVFYGVFLMVSYLILVRNP